MDKTPVYFDMVLGKTIDVKGKKSEHRDQKSDTSPLFLHA